MRLGLLRCARLSFVLLLVAAIALPAVSCAGAGMPKNLEVRLRKAVEDAMTKHDIPGAIVGVWSPKNGELVMLKGTADIKTGAAVQGVDRARICSITKTFTVTVVLELVDEGRLGLEDRLAEYYPDIPNASDITISQLCNMTAGIYNYSDDETFLATYTTDPGKVWKPEELVAIAISHPPDFLPGKGWKYSNTNSIILGMIVQKVTGRDIASQIASRLVDRLKLANTYYPEGTGIEGAHVHGYVGSEGDELTDATYLFNPSGMGASGALISNLADLRTWVDSLVNDPLLDRATQQKRLTFVPGHYDYFGVPVKYGLGILSCEGYLGHPGDGLGNTNAALRSPKTGTTIVVLLNKSPNNDGFMALTLFSELAKIMNGAESK